MSPTETLPNAITAAADEFQLGSEAGARTVVVFALGHDDGWSEHDVPPSVARRIVYAALLAQGVDSEVAWAATGYEILGEPADRPLICDPIRPMGVVS